MSITTTSTDTKLIECPYCKSHGYDWPGLKLHVELGLCPDYGKVKAK
jgi:hypothetical protein